ncbi:hypothetical protein swp_0612 [Shewanella piezotolerans WP3]|uniref:Uncharacterized protein n=1 Tax=Shewanella piezotolerans (strain WP3 / JCM 13877) TaxID=225849 RepID=B8CIF8_SHEPW|nr:hypothetical protein swp_0612 [Shewanella piezotolerans WP3]
MLSSKANTKALTMQLLAAEEFPQICNKIKYKHRVNNIKKSE